MNGKTIFETYRARLAIAQDSWGGNAISVFAPGQPCTTVPPEWKDLNTNQRGFWESVAIEADGFRPYETQPGESVMGIALRELKNEDRWLQIITLNQNVYGEMSPHDYFPAHHFIRLPKA